MTTDTDTSTTHGIYIVELDPAACDLPPDDHACVYVGITGLTPEERFANHKAGKRSSRIVKRYGVRLRPDLYAGIPRGIYAEMQAAEVAAADLLKGIGYHVHGGH